MEMCRRSTLALVTALGMAAGLSMSCGSDDDVVDGSTGGASGNATGGASGSAAGGASGSATGGASGSATGGASGSATGGASGSATGGASGSATGGASGSATGGASGSATGGASGSATGGASGSSGVIFSEDYNSIADGWDCSDPVPSAWTNLTACSSRNYGGVFHYGGEITSGGRSGNSLKQWKAPGTGEGGYTGYINYWFDSAEFGQHHRTLYSRVYVKFPPELNATGCLGACPKLMGRIYGGTSPDGTAKEVYLNLTGGGTMKTSPFQITIDGASPPFDNIYSTQDAADYGLFDGNWHALELGVHVSTPGQADGQIHLFLDGTEIQVAGGSGESPAVGQTHVAFNWASDVYMTAPLVPGVGNLTPEGTAVWTSSDDQWHAIEWDDFVVSSAYVGP